MRVPLHLLWLFPLVAAVIWFATLLTLLIRWLVRGMPKYPDQSNPLVAFISDIAAFEMKPVFLVGGSITAVAFVGTVCSVHYARYHHSMYGIYDVRWKLWLSILSVIAGIVASSGLVLLGIMDTFRHHEEHNILLKICFGGLSVCAICTSIVYWDQTKKPSPFRRLRLYCIASTAVVALEVCLAIPFMFFMYTGWYRFAGVLEWVICFTGVFYILAFVGFVAVPKEALFEQERQQLLQEDSRESLDA
ncbi:Frag1/DRAM/Sfk1 [Lineolata rhizophorae]|uniref:Frag1/DRAM/Sfk1 n=1 Tax=Lineolata rhizophorae TaxID=578093 RepID=A0A6A6P0D6_9PEZI|nr:Frag1/DRAM/Sfk1 [Lineolata rhizophorae]